MYLFTLMSAITLLKLLTHPLFGNIRSPNGNFSQNTQSNGQEYGSLFCLSGGYIAAVKLYRWCNLHAGNTTGSWRLACRAVMADEWIYADFRQFFVVSRCCCGCYWQKAHFYRRLSPVLPEQRYDLPDTGYLYGWVVQVTAGSCGGLDIGQRQRRTGPSL